MKIFKLKMDAYDIIKYPLSTEKSIRLMQTDNKLVFVVNNKATKKEIKKAVEEMFQVEVRDVNTLINQDGEKRAYIKFSAKNPAIDIATRMGLI